MDLKEATGLIESPVVQKYLSNIDADAEAALDEHKSNLSGMTLYPPAYVKEYKDDAKAMDDAWGTFNEEVNRITFGKAKDGKAAMAAYKRYVITLSVLEEQNVKYSAYVGAGVATLIAAFGTLLIEASKRAEKMIKELEKELPELLKALKKAKKEVKEAEAQRMINVGITVVSLLIPGVGLAGRIAIAAGTFVVQAGIDAALGPGKPGALGLSNNFVGDVASVPKSVRPPVAKFAGIATGLITLKLDGDEIADAEKIVADIQKRVAKVQKLLKDLDRWLITDPAAILKLHKAVEVAVGEAQKSAKKFKSAEKERLKLLKELAEIK